MATDPDKRPFPVAPILLFPLVGVPALAFVMAAAYAAMLMISLDPAALLALPIYGVLWTTLFFPALAPPLLLAGLLYAIAVHRFASPRLMVALLAAAAAAVIFAAAAFLAKILALDLASAHLTVDDLVPAIAGCVLAVIPGWWASRKLADRKRRRRVL